MYPATGNIQYYDSGWVVMYVHPSIQQYYRHWLKWDLGLQTNKPKHGCHVTVVSGKYEQVQTHPLWKKHDMETVDFEYETPMKMADTTWWLEVHAPKLTELRNELGLTDTPFWPFHLTVGNRKNLT